MVQTPLRDYPRLALYFTSQRFFVGHRLDWIHVGIFTRLGKSADRTKRREVSDTE